MKPLRSGLGAAAMACALLAGCAATGPQSSAGAASGPVWTIAQRNTGSYGEDAQLQVTRRPGVWGGDPAVLEAYSTGATVVQTADGSRWLALIGADGRPIAAWDPPLGPPQPARVGESSVSHHRVMVFETGRIAEFDYICTVDAFEQVVVPAGTFDTYKVRCSAGTGGLDTFWFSPALGMAVKTTGRRNVTSTFGPGTQQTELVSYEAGR